MTPITNKRIERLAGLDIKLWFKSGRSVQLGDGLLISDGIDAHIWIGQRVNNGKDILISAGKVQETKVESLTKVTYRDVKTGNFETLRF